MTECSSGEQVCGQSLTEIRKNTVCKPVPLNAASRSTSRRSEGTESTLVSAVASPTIQVQIEDSVVSVPVSMDTTVIDVIRLLIEHQETAETPHHTLAGTIEQFYLKECIDGDADMYKRAMSNNEKIMHCLYKQQEEGKRLSFSLHKMSTATIEDATRPVTDLEQINSGSGTPREPADKTNGFLNYGNLDPAAVPEIQFFSPPHVVEIKDRNHQRRNSLPSYVSFQDSEAAENARRRANMQTPKSKEAPLYIPNGQNLLSDIMKRVVQETKHSAEFSENDSVTSAEDSPSKQLSYSPVSSSESPFHIKSLVCSPYKSPQKLYPKFLFTPNVSSVKEDSEMTRVLQTNKQTHEDTEDEIVDGDVEHRTLDTSYSSPPTSESPTTDDGDTLVHVNEQDSPRMENGMFVTSSHQEQGKENYSLKEHANEGTIVSNPLNTSTPKTADKVSVPLTSPSTTTSTPGQAAGVPQTTEKLVSEGSVHQSKANDQMTYETKHVFVRRERKAHSPPPTILSYGHNQQQQQPTSPNGTATHLQTENDSTKINEARSDKLVNTTTVEPPYQSQDFNDSDDVDTSRGDEHSNNETKTTEYDSEMNLMDSFTSYLNSTFSNDESLLSSSYTLVSPNRTKHLIDEATAHARRRRTKEPGDKTLTTRMTSDSALLDDLQSTDSAVKHQESSPPLISPSRHERLVRQASDKIIGDRIRKRSSETGNNISDQDKMKSVDDIGLKPKPDLIEEEEEDQRFTKSMVVRSSFSKDNAYVNGTANLKDSSEKPSQQRRFPSLFRWKSFKSRQNSNKVTGKKN